MKYENNTLEKLETLEKTIGVDFEAFFSELDGKIIDLSEIIYDVKFKYLVIPQYLKGTTVVTNSVILKYFISSKLHFDKIFAYKEERQNEQGFDDCYVQILINDIVLLYKDDKLRNDFNRVKHDYLHIKTMIDNQFDTILTNETQIYVIIAEYLINNIDNSISIMNENKNKEEWRISEIINNFNN